MAPERWAGHCAADDGGGDLIGGAASARPNPQDRKSTRLNSSHSQISYAVFCLKNNADVTLLAPHVHEALAGYAAEGSIRWERRHYAGAADLEGAFLVIAATDDTDANIAVFEDAERRAMLVNVVDVPPLCNFILPAIVRQGPLAIAISTAGASPALAKRMKAEIAAQFGEPYARLALLLNEVRGWAKGTLPTYQERKEFFEDIVGGDPDPVELLRARDEQAVRELIARAQRERAAQLARA